MLAPTRPIAKWWLPPKDYNLAHIQDNLLGYVATIDTKLLNLVTKDMHLKEPEPAQRISATSFYWCSTKLLHLKPKEVTFCSYLVSRYADFTVIPLRDEGFTVKPLRKEFVEVSDDKPKDESSEYPQNSNKIK